MDVISVAVRTFVTTRFATVSDLEILLLLKDNPNKEWGALAASKAMLADRSSTSETLENLTAKGLLTARLVGNETIYRYAPVTAEDAGLMEQVAHLYSQYRVRIIGLIASNPVDKIRTFSDAFRFRKNEEKD